MLFTSESVFPGHPDKLCDQISDAILDSCIEVDPNSRVAVECMATKNELIIAGEVSSGSDLNYSEIARKVIADVGYTVPGIGFSSKDVNITNLVHTQSPDISMGVDVGGAGDNGLMFGGSVANTPDQTPIAIYISRELQRQFRECISNDSDIAKWFLPDGKVQFTVDCSGVPKPKLVVFNVQHIDMDIVQIRQWICDYVIDPVIREAIGGGYLSPIDDSLIDDMVKIAINPTGKFIIGGPLGDTGLTGRKIIVDTYGGYFRHGGGAFSGKDSSKVDRSGAYMARYIANNIVSAGLMKECEVQLAYAIGVAKPVSISISSYDGSVDGKMLERLGSVVSRVFDCRPRAIDEQLMLRKSIKDRGFRYQDLAAYGHVGGFAFKSAGSVLPWECSDKVKEIQSMM